MEKMTYNTRKKISWQDIQELVQNVIKYYDNYMLPDRSPLTLLIAIYTTYKKHMYKQPDKNINLNIEANRPKVLRSEMIRKCANTEYGQKIEQQYNSVKGRINARLKILTYKNDKKTGKIFNPKGLVLRADPRKGEAEVYNFFAIMDPLPKPPQKHLVQSEEQLPIALSTPMQVLKKNFNKWRLYNFLGEEYLTLTPSALIQIETEINPNTLDEERLAYFYISCLFRQHNYPKWWGKVKDRPKVIWHLINLLFKSYHRPFWRAAFVLQYADSDLFYKVVTEFPKNILKKKNIRMAIDIIINNSVRAYLLKNKDREMYAEELLKEFSVFKDSFE